MMLDVLSHQAQIRAYWQQFKEEGLALSIDYTLEGQAFRNQRGNEWVAWSEEIKAWKEKQRELLRQALQSWLRQNELS